MRSLLFWILLMGVWPVLAQNTVIKENLGPNINTAEDQILPVFSHDGQTLYFSQNSSNSRYEIWYSQCDDLGNWQPKQRAVNLNPPTDGSKYVFAQVENDLLLVNGWFERRDNVWFQSKGLSWYIPSQNRYIQLDIPALQTQAQGRFVNAFLHPPSKTLLLSYAESEQKDLYVCQAENPSANWTELRWHVPVRLPNTINSVFDDTTPFLDTDGTTLYFASNRPGGYGEADIYFSRRLDDSWMSWSEPENLGFSVNSNYSEIYYCAPPLGDFTYFVSYKHSYGSGDIFRLLTDSVQNPIPAVPESANETVSIQPLISPQVAEETELLVDQYKPNNLVFLIDRSASMRPASKLPLLKLSLKRLISQLRNIDRLTLISFANSAVIHYSTQGVIEKDSLYQLIDNFEASGKTKANQGLQMAYDYTEQNFIADGNNEIILVTDGLFSLSPQDRQRMLSNQSIVLSTVGLGDDRNALSSLSQMAAEASGSYIHIQEAATGTEALLEEVKARSRR
ncbi:MAG: VWA domain-containing protein [Bacteroidota bacterium]